MQRSRPVRRGALTALSALVIGVSIGAAATAGHALLLYSGRGLLNAAGFMVGLTLTSLAAGAWVGGAEADPRVRRGWFWVVIAFGAGGVFASAWSAIEPVRETPAGGALAVLILLAQPAYTCGVILAALGVRARGSRVPIAPVTLAGAAVGVIASATTLIPRLEAGTIYLGAAALVVLAAVLATARPPAPYDADANMNGKVAIITGVGERGQVGFAIAAGFLRAGARVVITGRSDSVHELARELSATGEVAAVAADLVVGADVARVIGAARDRFGRLDVLVNVAGGLRVIKPVADTDVEDWRNEVQRNAETTYAMCRAALPLLRESRGAIINFASPAGVRAVKNLGAFSAAKAAVVALTRAIALEEKPNGVRANAIAPGLVDTEQNRRTVDDPERARWVTRDEITRVALFLASDAAAGISGETIHVLGDGLR
jgi:NAD(P)-dependent dehydrogenase (short-subunit alcohol dehydrogenase family)